MAKKMSKEELKAKMMADMANKKETVEMTNEKAMTETMAEVTVSAAAMNIAIKAEEKAAKATVENEKKAKWLENALLNEDGKYQIIVDLDLDNRGSHKTWTPYAWLVKNENKKIRILWTFALELAAQGKAVEVSKDKIAENKKAAKSSKKTEVKVTEQDNDSELVG